MKNIALIGSTGSIGRQVLKVVERYPSRFKITALVAGKDSPLFKQQVEKFKPCLYAAYEEDKSRALSAAQCEADIIFNAASGFSGLEYSYNAISAGKTLALANKETLVCGGEFIMAEAKKHGAQILPVDSEHSAIWQCLHFENRPVRRLIITASGGPFLNYPREMLKGVTSSQALNHPTWKMGGKITVDSATLMNKGYEVIEAHILYGTPYKDIQAVIQPKSIVHSMVEYEDGSILAQMSYPTMEIPIQLALTYPERLKTEVLPMDFTKGFSVEFLPLGKGRFALYDLARETGEKGGTLPCAMNAADEEAVNAFLRGQIGYLDIERAVTETLTLSPQWKINGLNDLKEADLLARQTARRIINGLMDR